MFKTRNNTLGRTVSFFTPFGRTRGMYRQYCTVLNTINEHLKKLTEVDIELNNRVTHPKQNTK